MSPELCISVHQVSWSKGLAEARPCLSPLSTEQRDGSGYAYRIESVSNTFSTQVPMVNTPPSGLSSRFHKRYFVSTGRFPISLSYLATSVFSLLSLLPGLLPPVLDPTPSMFHCRMLNFHRCISTRSTSRSTQDKAGRLISLSRIRSAFHSCRKFRSTTRTAQGKGGRLVSVSRVRQAHTRSGNEAVAGILPWFVELLVCFECCCERVKLFSQRRQR